MDLSDTQRLLGRPEDAEVSFGPCWHCTMPVLVSPRSGLIRCTAWAIFSRSAGKYNEARTTLDRALRLQQRLNNERGMADCLRTMGQAAYEEDSLKRLSEFASSIKCTDELEKMPCP